MVKGWNAAWHPWYAEGQGVEGAAGRSRGRSAGCRVLRQDDPAEVVLSGIPRKQGINAPASFDKCIFPCDGLSRSPASGLGDNLTHG